MHELSICEGIMQVMEDQARTENFSQVAAIRLEIGPLAGVELDALRFSFDVVTRGTIADGCRLEIIETEGRAHCLKCDHTVSLKRRFDACPRCGGYGLHVTGGDELRIKDMEVN